MRSSANMFLVQVQWFLFWADRGSPYKKPIVADFEQFKKKKRCRQDPRRIRVAKDLVPPSMGQTTLCVVIAVAAPLVEGKDPTTRSRHTQEFSCSHWR